MSMEQNKKDIKHLDRACDTMAQACYELAQANDYVAKAALVTLEGILDDMCDRVTELRAIRDTIKKASDEYGFDPIDWTGSVD